MEYDYIVIGVGGIGSGTLYWLARNAPNSKILGLEQFELGHVRGGSQDVSRIIWREVEEESGVEIDFKCGGLIWTTQHTGQMDTVHKWKDSMSLGGAECEFLEGNQISSRWPQIQLQSDNPAAAVYDPEGGLVDAAMGNAAHQRCAVARGVTIITHAKVISMEKFSGRSGMEVRTTKGVYRGGKVLVSSGAWINQVLSSLNVHIPVKVSQENVTYFATPHLKEFTKRNFPVTIFLDRTYSIYSLPVHGIPGFKIGVDAGGDATTGDTRTWTPDPRRETICTNFLKKFIPKAVGPIMETKVCLYTMTYDRTFVVDTLESRGYPDVIVCCGAGHAYKFAALLGKVLSELAVAGQTQYDISAFKLERPAINDPNYIPHFYGSSPDEETGMKARL